MTDKQKKIVYIVAGVIAVILLLLIAKRLRENEAGQLQHPHTNPMTQPNSALWGKNGFPMLTPQIANLPAEQLYYTTQMPITLTVNSGAGNSLSGIGGFGGDTSVYVPLFGFVGYTDYALY